ncbi:phospholipid carrier-dependent glycosyltransferase [Sphingobium sp. H39-3-25]|uniref:phospholipid carrier-dependent glycosyltransferase n=1 Tax=Sphingobium arseniciresistens TaxID=3030834 RepID=UPI0023B9BD6E|nr:phospholipid carrier-dependent glycosyltransferase [Sphingobium arseniciresistens]
MPRPLPAAALRPQWRSAAGWWIALASLLLLACGFTGIDHDEGQYVAAVALMRHGLPYRNFAYLQTPLQPLLLAPLAWWCEGWLFPALRAVNALLGAGAVAMLWLAARRAGASERGAALAALALASSHMLLFAASVARNDALPLFLHCAGLWLFLPVLRADAPRRPLTAWLAGLALAGAASAKISYGLPAAAVGVFALLHVRILGRGPVLALALGGLLGGLPTFWLWALAPEAARFGIIDYSLKAPFEWRTLNGQAAMLEAPLSLLRMLRFLAQGCGLVALVTIGAATWKARKAPLAVRHRVTGAPRPQMLSRLLALLILAGLVAAWLPRPIYVQYLGPLLPALFLYFGLVAEPFLTRRWLRALVALAILAGIAQTTLDIAGNLALRRSPVLVAARDARTAGQLVRARHGEGAIVALSPERVIDSGIPLDPRFATGLFLFRTRSVMTPQQSQAFHALPMDALARGLDMAPPTAILTGMESATSRLAPDGLDAPLVLWARRQGYRRVILPATGTALYLRPASAPHP